MIWKWLTKTRETDQCFAWTMLGIMIAGALTIPFKHLFDVDIMAAISALLIMPEFVLEWYAKVSIMPFVNQFLLPMLVLVLFILLVIKLRAPEEKGK